MWISPETLATSDTPQDGFEPVFDTQCPLTGPTMKAVAGAPALLNGAWITQWVVQPLTDAETAQVAAAALANLEADLVGAVQQLLDSSAKVAGYDSIRVAVTYADEPSVPKFQAEGIAFRKWRSLAWDYTYTQLALMTSGARTTPAVTEFLAELPALGPPA